MWQLVALYSLLSHLILYQPLLGKLKCLLSHFTDDWKLRHIMQQKPRTVLFRIPSLTTMVLFCLTSEKWGTWKPHFNALPWLL